MLSFKSEYYLYSNCACLKNVVTCLFDNLFQKISSENLLDAISYLSVINKTVLVSVNQIKTQLIQVM